MNQEEWRAAWRRRDKRDRKKVNQRWVDRWWFKKMLPKAMYDKYEIHQENKTKDAEKITFPITTGTWGTITHFSFFDRIVSLEEVERGVEKGGKKK